MEHAGSGAFFLEARRRSLAPDGSLGGGNNAEKGLGSSKILRGAFIRDSKNERAGVGAACSPDRRRS